jgi:hypothetical protein
VLPAEINDEETLRKKDAYYKLFDNGYFDNLERNLRSKKNTNVLLIMD